MRKEYANVSERLSAFVIDGLMIVMFFVALFLSMIFYGAAIEPRRSVLVETLTAVIFFVLFFGFFWFAVWNTIYRVGKTGQSLGRKATNIAVLDDEGNPIGFGRAFLRETIGRFVSGIVFCIGYLNFFWDTNRQTWHDKMVDSYVYHVPDDFSADEERFADIGSRGAQ